MFLLGSGNERSPEGGHSIRLLVYRTIGELGSFGYAPSQRLEVYDGRQVESV